MTNPKIEEMSAQEAREVLRDAFGLREWNWHRLFERPMLVLAAVNLVLLYGVMHSHWTPLELMLAYAAEIVAFAFWYGLRVALIQNSFKSFFAVLMICGVALGFVVMLLGVLGKYDLLAGAKEARLPALILFGIYGWQAYLAWRNGLEQYGQRDALRLVIVIAFYVNLGIFTILACVMVDKGFHAQAGGMVMLVVVKFLVDALLRTRLQFE